MQGSDRNRNSFADIARLLSDFFRDLDVVPSDVVAGLVLLRKFQKIERKAIVEQVRRAIKYNLFHLIRMICDCRGRMIRTSSYRELQ